MRKLAASQKRDAQALIQAEQRYRDLYEHAPDMLASVEAKTGLVVECNQTLLDNLGYSKEEVIGRPAVDLYHPDSWGDGEKAVPDATCQLRDAGLKLRRKHGLPMDVSLSVTTVRDQQGHLLFSQSSWRDISAQMRAEKALRENEARFRSIFDASPVSIWEEDFLQLQAALDPLKAQGANLNAAYFADNPEFLREAARLVKVRQVNAAVGSRTCKRMTRCIEVGSRHLVFGFHPGYRHRTGHDSEPGVSSRRRVGRADIRRWDAEFEAKQLAPPEFIAQFLHGFFVNPLAAFAEGNVLAVVI